MSDDKGNVVDFIKHVENLQEETDPGYVPEDEDIESFLKVLDFVRTLSTSNDGSIEFDNETLKVILVSYVTDETLGEDGLVTKQTALHKEIEMDFPCVTNTDVDTEEVLLIAAVEDFNDGLYGIAQSYEEQDDESN